MPDLRRALAVALLVAGAGWVHVAAWRAVTAPRPGDPDCVPTEARIVGRYERSGFRDLGPDLAYAYETPGGETVRTRADVSTAFFRDHAAHETLAICVDRDAPRRSVVVGADHERGWALAVVALTWLSPVAGWWQWRRERARRP